MGTAAVQGKLWGARAQDWLDCNEPAWTPVFSEILDVAGVGAGTYYLDIGCGAGGALVLAAARGAKVSGLDASKALTGVARKRLKEADIRQGEMEELPFGDGAFDRVTAINSVQFAGDVPAALAEAARVCASGGRVTVASWGRREDCAMVAKVMPAVFALLPPSPPGPPPRAYGEPGVWEGLLTGAGLVEPEGRDIPGALVFPDLETAVRASLSASARAIAHAGEATVRGALEAAYAPFVGADGSVRVENRFRVVSARRV